MRQNLVSLSFGFIGLQQSIIGSFRALENTLIAMIIGLISIWGFQFPFAYLFSKYTAMNQNGLWWAFTISNIFSSILAIIWYKWGK